MSEYNPLVYKFDYRTKETLNQIKKHYTQFTEAEHIILKCVVDSFKRDYIIISQHATKHIPFFNADITKQVLNDYQLIEFNITCKEFSTSPRILIRSNKALPIIKDNVKTYANVCMVIDILECKIITAYANTIEDNHKTLNLYRYNESMDIVKICQCTNGGFKKCIV